MTDTITTLANNLKVYYRDYIADATEYGTVGFAIFEKNKDDVDGLRTEFAVRVRKNWGVLSQQRTSLSLPTSQNMTMQNPQLSLIRHHALMEFDNALIKSSKTQQGSFARSVDIIMKDTMESLMLDAGRQLYGDGNGICAYITAITAPGAPATVTVHNAQYIYEGLPIVIYTAAGVFKEATSVISVNESNNTFTATITVATAVGDEISIGYSAAINNRNKTAPEEIYGLRAAIGNTLTFPTYLNIARATYSRWNSTVRDDSNNVFGVAGGNAALAETAMIDVYNSVKKNTALNAQGQAAMEFVILTSFEAQQAYFNQLQSFRQYTIPTSGMERVKLAGGYEGLAFMDGTPIVADKLCPVEYDALAANGVSDNMFFVNKKTFSWYVWQWYDFDDTDGNVLSRVPSSDSYEARINAYLQLGCDNPIKNARYVFIR